jgi:predicted Abi (CAAX) family protease
MKCFYAAIDAEFRVTKVIPWDTTYAGRPPVSGALVPCPSDTFPGETFNPTTGQFTTPKATANVSVQVEHTQGPKEPSAPVPPIVYPTGPVPQTTAQMEAVEEAVKKVEAEEAKE